MKTVGDRRHPCLAQTVVLNYIPMRHHSSGLHLYPSRRAAQRCELDMHDIVLPLNATLCQMLF